MGQRRGLASSPVADAGAVAAAAGLANVTFTAGTHRPTRSLTASLDVAISRFLRGRAAGRAAPRPDRPATHDVYPLSPPGRIGDVLTRAGFRDVTVTPLRTTVEVGKNAATAAEFERPPPCAATTNAAPPVTNFHHMTRCQIGMTSGNSELQLEC
ncbi:hypothetical protein ABT373_39705 [Streptomyces sp. NPDC000070]|uniref:hypothetical protein n=1 Tax=Streptomyces sp. NPDC000070 TaxID=3154240 RepID=UPI00332ACB96